MRMRADGGQDRRVMPAAGFGAVVEEAADLFVEHHRLDHPELEAEEQQQQARHEVVIAIEFHGSTWFDARGAAGTPVLNPVANRL